MLHAVYTVFDSPKLKLILTRYPVVIWLDCGDDLSRSPPGPWLSAPRATFHTYFRPVVMYKPNISSKEHQVVLQDDNRISDDIIGDRSSDYDLPQSLSLLAKFYGRSLNTSTMAVDPFYLLSELFAFASSSEVGLLNTIKSKLDQIWQSTNQPDISDPWSSQPDTSMHAQVRLIYYREVLEKRIHKIQETLTFIQSRDRLRWPRARTGKSTQTVERMEQDFQYLLTRARQLQERCDRDLTTIMNNITLAQARLGINQARRVFRFTVLATAYVPLSFSSSVFSMVFVNFQEDSRGYLTWILVSIGVLAMSIVIFTWDSARFRRWV
jgi:Mg2+ and Co2+ transporter CorA